MPLFCNVSLARTQQDSSLSKRVFRYRLFLGAVNMDIHLQTIPETFFSDSRPCARLAVQDIVQRQA